MQEGRKHIHQQGGVKMKEINLHAFRRILTRCRLLWWCPVAIGLSIQRRIMMAMHGAGDFVYRCRLCDLMEKDPVVSNRPRQHVDTLKSMFVYNTGMRASIILWQNTLLNAAHIL